MKQVLIHLSDKAEENLKGVVSQVGLAQYETILKIFESLNVDETARRVREIKKKP